VRVRGSGVKGQKITPGVKKVRGPVSGFSATPRRSADSVHRRRAALLPVLAAFVRQHGNARVAQIVQHLSVHVHDFWVGFDAEAVDALDVPVELVGIETETEELDSGCLIRAGGQTT